GLFGASNDVSAHEFERFVRSIELEKNYPGIQGIGFSRLLRPNERDALIAGMREQGFSDFRIWPDQPRDEYNAIVYLQPMNNRNHIAIGYDMSTESVRREAMYAARDSGKPTAS